jgi:hypothetical protein
MQLKLVQQINAFVLFVDNNHVNNLMFIDLDVTCGGRTWPQPTVLEWLTQVGFTNLSSAQQGLAILVAGQKAKSGSN